MANTKKNVSIHVLQFFEDTIEPEMLALHIRRTLFMLNKLAIKEDNKSDIPNDRWLIDCAHYLNEFAETIDPYLNKD